MAHSETFYVSINNNQVRAIKGNTTEYFNPDRNSKNLGKAKYCIEVFGHNHKKVAEHIRDIIDEKGMSDKLFHIRIETK